MKEYNQRVNVVMHTPFTLQDREAIKKALMGIGLEYMGEHYDYVEDKVTFMFDKGEIHHE